MRRFALMLLSVVCFAFLLWLLAQRPTARKPAPSREPS